LVRRLTYASSRARATRCSAPPDLEFSAWSYGNVPQGITTSPHIARAYARIALGYLRDARISPRDAPIGHGRA